MVHKRKFTQADVDIMIAVRQSATWAMQQGDDTIRAKDISRYNKILDIVSEEAG